MPFSVIENLISHCAKEEDRRKMRKLGPTQQSVLESLKRHGAWYPGCGWVWDTASNTTRIMESLVARGYVITTKEGKRTVYLLAAPIPKRRELPCPA
jgi:hypothetical protein